MINSSSKNLWSTLTDIMDLKNISIELANLENFEDILKLSRLLHSPNLINGENIKKSIMNDYIFVAKDNNKIVGYIRAELFDTDHRQLPNSIFLSELYVLEKYRKRGIGKELVQTFLKNTYPKQFTHFSVTHDPDEPHLTDFYGMFGFKVIGKTNAGNIKMTRDRNFSDYWSKRDNFMIKFN